MKNIWKWSVAVFAVSLSFFGGWFWLEKGRNLDQNEAPILSGHDQSSTNEQKQSDDLKSDITVDTSNWETYRNEALKLSFKYPGTFRLDESIRDDGHVVSVMEYDENKRDLSNKSIPGYYPLITIHYWKDLNDSHLIGGDWVGKEKYKTFQEVIVDTEHTFITIKSEIYLDGTKAYVVLLPGTDSGYESILFEHAGGYYQINFSLTQNPLNENIKKAILSSIRPLK